MHSISDLLTHEFFGLPDPSPTSRGPSPLTVVCLTSGRIVRMDRRRIDAGKTARAATWLQNLVNSRRSQAFPNFEDWSARAANYGGGLALSIFFGGEQEVLVATLGVALRNPHAMPLWRVLTALPRVNRSYLQPPIPWCAYLDEVGGMETAEAHNRLAGFAQLCAAAWAAKPNPRTKKSRALPGTIVSYPVKTDAARAS